MTHTDVLSAAGVPELDLTSIVTEYAHPLVFATVSGAHLYGFPSIDSDVDLRGAHTLPVTDLVGLRRPVETISRMWDREGVEMDLVTHDLGKFARLLLRPNGYVLEQLLSPLVVHTTPAHSQLVGLVPGLLTSRHAGHYQGFASTQLTLYGKTEQLKPLLYTFRILLTGIHLMRTGVVVAHLPTLIEYEYEYELAPAYLPELIAAKADGEHLRVDACDAALTRERIDADIAALRVHLDQAQQDTQLPPEPSVESAVDDLIIRARLASDPSLLAR